MTHDTGSNPTPAADRDDPRDLAALYVAGALTPDEHDAVEARLAAGEAALIAAVRELDDVTAHLLHGAPSLIPPATIKSALLVRTGALADGSHRRDNEAAANDDDEHDHDHVQVWRDWKGDQADGPLFTLRSEEGDWEETGVDGIQVRRLFVDEQRNRMTAMFRMAPGAAYVPHVHDEPEECYVLEGDLHVGDELVMHAGDYQRATAGSLHPVQYTKGGCLLLVTSSLHDEVA